MTEQYDIIKKYGLPRELISYPSCGKLYGHHRTKVCKFCGECSKCCICKDKRLIIADEFITQAEM